MKNHRQLMNNDMHMYAYDSIPSYKEKVDAEKAAKEKENQYQRRKRYSFNNPDLDLNESKLNSKIDRIVKESVNRVLKENFQNTRKMIKESLDRYILIYDGEEMNDSFTTDNLKAAINAAIQDYEDGGYDTIEIYDSVENRIIWTTDED